MHDPSVESAEEQVSSAVVKVTCDRINDDIQRDVKNDGGALTRVGME